MKLHNILIHPNLPLLLLAEPKYVSCVRLSEVMEGLSHDSVNRFLLREHYS